MMIGDNQLKNWAGQLKELDSKLDALNDAKRDLYAAIRAEHGKHTADSLKLAMRWSSMEPEKREAHSAIEVEAKAFLATIEGSHAARVASAVPTETKSDSPPQEQKVTKPQAPFKPWLNNSNSKATN